MHMATFEMKSGSTLGNIVSLAIDDNMHKFIFLPYGIAWKGCRDFVYVIFPSSLQEC